MRIVIDRARCAATGMCTSIAPEHFELDESGELNVLDDDVVPNTLEAVEAAVSVLSDGGDLT